METQSKSNLSSACVAFVGKLFKVIIVSVLLFLVVGEIVMPDERDSVKTECQKFQAQWEQVKENGEKIPVEIPGKVQAERGEVVTITTTLPNDIYNGEVLCLRTIWQDVEIYIDGELRERYDTENSRLFGKNSVMRNVFVDLSENDAGKPLMYKISSDSKYAGVIRQSYIGDRTSVWMYLIKQSGSKTIVSVFLLFMSLFCIIVCTILRTIYKKKLALENLAWTIFFCALWMLSETECRQLLFKNISILSSYTYWSLMLLPIPMCLYMNEVQEGRYQKYYSVCLTYSALVFMIGTVLQVFDIVQFVQQLPLMHCGVIASIVVILTTITRDLLKKQISSYLAIGVGVYGMLFTAVCELVLYYMDAGLSLGTILGLGLIFLLIMAIIKTGQDLLEFEHRRQQAILEKEAQAKFLANMSHEIRTPINAVIGMNEMILRESDNEVISEYAHNIQSASNMLLDLINDILDVSKIESGQLELFEDTYLFSKLMEDQMLLLNVRAAEKAISTRIEVDPQLPSKFYGDELRIRQILTNLLSNAVKYTKEGSVTLKVTFTWIDEDTVKLIYSVTDTGMGIRQEDVPKLFESFKRLELNVNRNIEGTGLGLSIVKQLVGLMQGDISVESTYGKGSTFTVSIPQKVIDKQPVGNLIEALQTGKKENSVKANVFTAPDASMLVVDDNSLNLIVMKELLKRTKIQTDFVTSGIECLERTRRKAYDIIFMDHMMPELDGVETLHRLREDALNPNRNTIVIALTANAIAGCREKYLEYGFNDYFSKPIQADKLETLLLEYLPQELIQRKGITDESIIDREKGISYCLGSEDFYQEMLSEFCNQCAEYLPQLKQAYQVSDWEKYAGIVNIFKENALNIGADAFAEKAQQHENAGENKDADFIRAEYADFIAAMERLVKSINEMV